MKKMKYIKHIILILLISIYSCEDERDLDFINGFSIPSNIGATFTVAQDNSGVVTIYPTAEGAYSFTIDFGDGSSEVSIKNGESTTHTFTEGSYTVVVKAYNLKGDSVESSLPLQVSFKAPENVDVTIENNAVTSKQVDITVDADFAITYDFYSGESGITQPVASANVGETINYTYTNSGTYDVRVVVKGAAIETTEYTASFEVTEILQPVTNAPTPPNRNAVDVISLYGESYDQTTVDLFVTDWSVLGLQEEITVDNNNILAYRELQFAGIITESSPIDASSMEFFHFDVWTTDVTTFKAKFVDFNGTGFNNNLDNIEYEVERSIDNQGEWVSFDIPLSEFDGVPFTDINQLVISAVPTGTVFVDNMYFWKEPSVFNDLPVTFDNPSLTYTWTGFGSSSFGPIPAEVKSNPDATGINTTANVLEIQKPAGAQVWAGASMPLDNPIDFANNGSTITIKVWSPRAGVPILFKTEDLQSPKDGNGNPSVFAEVIATTTVANQWEELVFDLSTFSSFSTSIEYDNVIIFPDFNTSGAGETFYFDDIEFASLKFPVSFEIDALTYNWVGFGNPSFGPIPTAIIPNPNVSGINTSSNVLEVQKPANSQVWAGASLAFDSYIDFNYGTKVKVKVWSPRAGVPILFKTEDLESPKDGNGNPTVFVEITATTTVANQWEELTFDLTTSGSFSTSIEYDNIIVFPDFGTLGAGETFYFDDFILTN